MTSLEREIETLKGNVQDMQRQLSNAHKRIHDLIAEKSSAIDEVQKEKDLIKELTDKLKDTDKEAIELIQSLYDFEYMRLSSSGREALDELSKEINNSNKLL